MAGVKMAGMNVALRVFLLLILPFLMGFSVLSHRQSVEGQQIEPFAGGRNSTAGIFSLNFTHAQDSFAQIDSVFPLANYLDIPPLVSHKVTEVCFSDVGSRIMLANGTTLYPDFTWEVRRESMEMVIVHANATVCRGASSFSPGDYLWAAQIQTNMTQSELGANAVFYPDTRVRLKGEVQYGLLQGLAMIPAAYLFIWYPLFGIWRKIKEGMLAQ